MAAMRRDHQRVRENAEGDYHGDEPIALCDALGEVFDDLEAAYRRRLAEEDET